MSMLFEDNKSTKNISKRYETETADTDTSFGYKFVVKPPSRNSYNEDLSIVGHNEYSENKHNGIIENIKNRKRSLLNKSVSKNKEINALLVLPPHISSSSSSKSIITLPSIGKK